MKLPFLAAACIASGLLVGCAAESADGAAVGDQHLEELSVTKENQATQLTQMMELVRAGTAWHGTVDWAGLNARGQTEIRQGDGSDGAFYGALFHAFMAVPEGHQSVMPAEGCGTTLPYVSYSRRGVCGQPHDRGIIITAARNGNSLGLRRGDLVVGLGDHANAEMFDTLTERPMCTASRPSVSFAHSSVAATFGDLVHAGEAITVEAPDGTRREVVVPALSPVTDAAFVDCEDPFGRSRAVPAEASIRPDGVAVIRIPSWINPAEALPELTDMAAVNAYTARFEDAIAAVFDTVKSAPQIVWDMRGNGGGLTQVVLDIVSGMPGAQGGEISYCTGRNFGSDPPTFEEARYAQYSLTPGGRFAYAGKVAILIDGLNYSAADYFPYAAKKKANVLLVGSPTAGGFGAVTYTQPFDGPPAFSVTIDMNRCSSSEDDQPLEGRSVVPDIAVRYEPKDLVAGKDTVLERAVREITK